MRTGLLCLVAAGALCASEIPAGTDLQLRLQTTIDSAKAKSKDPVQFVVTAPVMLEGRIALAARTRVEGEIEDVKQPLKPDEQAQIQIHFSDAIGADGQERPLEARLTAVDNARETVDEEGRITGILASQTGTARLDQGISKIGERFPELGQFLGMAKSAVVQQADPNIHYEPGVEMTIVLTKALEWKETAPPPRLLPITPAEQLVQLVNREPMRTVALKPPTPSDITNLMFLGTRAQLEEAFQAAGWAQAADLNGESKLETFRALAEGRGYKEGPVSILLLAGKAPDLVFEKTNNTFASRHHLRIWKRPERFDGKEVWVCAATHDISIDFSDRDYTFIHRVDPQIDRERAKVVNDLLFTGKVKGLALVDRPGAPKNGQNATGDDVQTDGQMAVLEF